MGHLELGTHRPATRLVGALQIGDPQENMTPFTGAYTHPAVAMRANQLVCTHGKYLQALFGLTFCENSRPVLSVLAAYIGVFFSLMLLIAGMLLKTQGCIHNE